jgi:hypothetical protein
VSNFYEDENADRLNFGAKQLALARQGQLNQIVRKAAVFNAYTGFVKEGANTALAATGVPSGSLIQSSRGAGNAGTALSAGAKKQFNLNA